MCVGGEGRVVDGRRGMSEGKGEGGDVVPHYVARAGLREFTAWQAMIACLVLFT